MNLRTSLTIITLALMPQFVVGQTALTGKTMADTCAGCHGTDGVPAVAYIPPLAGLSAEDFSAAMIAYQNGTRRATIMNRIAPAFSETEIAAMAAYFASLPKPEVASSLRTRPEN